MRKIEKMIFVLLAGFFSMCMAVAADDGKKDYANNKHPNMACESCHVTKIPTTAPPDTLATCITCHGDYEKLAQVTSDSVPTNPHRTHFTDIPCGECHKIHTASSLQACTTCHNLEMTVP